MASIRLDYGIGGRENECPVLPFNWPHISMLAFGSVYESKANTQRICAIVGPQPEGVISQVLAGLNVVLICIGPVKLDFFALIRHRVYAGLVNPLGEEVSIGVVSAEETV